MDARHKVYVDNECHLLNDEVRTWQDPMDLSKACEMKFDLLLSSDVDGGGGVRVR